MSRVTQNKSIAGYHLLMILSAVDYRFNVHEDLVIRRFLQEEFPFDVNLDHAMNSISALAPMQWEDHFAQCMQDFEAEATEDERHDLLMFAVDLIKADRKVTAIENQYVDKMFDAWFPEGKDSVS
jgi:uncharacterized tellurite resistance protein B-like protein